MQRPLLAPAPAPQRALARLELLNLPEQLLPLALLRQRLRFLWLPPPDQVLHKVFADQ
jgi:hypothetical protein